jgi:hypothetical protein
MANTSMYLMMKTVSFPIYSIYRYKEGGYTISPSNHHANSQTPALSKRKISLSTSLLEISTNPFPFH